MSTHGAAEPQRVLICGDRNWTDRSSVRAELVALRAAYADLTICEGEARGADRIAREEAETLGIPVKRFPAEWSRYGRAAGPIRNGQMLADFRPTLVIAFHNALDMSKGTRNMVRQARAARIPTIVISASSPTAIV